MSERMRPKVEELIPQTLFLHRVVAPMEGLAVHPSHGVALFCARQLLRFLWACGL